MAWIIKERKIGRAGGEKQRASRQKVWDQKYGEDNWAIGYVVDGEFILQEDAITSIYNASYAHHFANQPADLEELISTAKALRNPHAEATTGVDLQIPAIMDYLDTHNLCLSGSEVVDIGSWNGMASHPISIRLSPLQIKCCIRDKWTLEKFWQERKVLAIWED